MSQSKFYIRVTVNCAGATTAGGEGDGCVDNVRLEKDAAFDPTGTVTPGTNVPTNLAAHRARVRGWLRWRNILLQLENGYMVEVSNIVRTGGDIDNSPDPIAFTVLFESVSALAEIKTRDVEGTPATILTGSAAVKRMVARALTGTLIETRGVYDATDVSGAAGNQPRGFVFESVKATSDNGSNLAANEAKVTVAVLDMES